MIAFALALALVLLAVSRPYHVTFYFLTLLQYALWLIGLWALVPSGEATDATVAFGLFGICAFQVGHLLTARLVPYAVATPRDRQAVSPVVVWSVVLTVTAFTAFHFSVTGLPVLSSSIETDRFDVTASGFFGIPGRMYLFGTSMAWILASADATMRDVRWLQSRPWLVATATLLGSSAVSGLKGQFLVLGVLVFGTHAVVHNQGMRVGAFLRRYWWMPAAAIAYLIGVATLYPSYSTSGGSLTDKLLERATSVGAEPAALVLTRHLRYQLANPLANDVSYFLHKYSGQSTDGMFAFERLVSTSILGFSPLRTWFAPPVTIGALAEVTYGFGELAGIAVLFAAGAAFTFIDLARFRTSLTTTGAAVFAVFMTNWLLKGNLVYQFLNNLAVVVMLTVVGVVSWLLVGRGPFFESVKGTPRYSRNSSISPPALSRQVGGRAEPLNWD